MHELTKEQIEQVAGAGASSYGAPSYDSKHGKHHHHHDHRHEHTEFVVHSVDPDIPVNGGSGLVRGRV